MISILLAAALVAADPADDRTYFKPDLFPTLVDPDCSHCRDEAKRKAGELRDDDRVLAWIRGDYTGGAIPIRWFLVNHRVISDTYGVFVYDPDAGFVRGWPASLDFRFHGWRNGIVVMSRKDGTLFDGLTGEAFEGPGKGERLKPIPVVETDWGPWLKANPGTVAYEMKPIFRPAAIPSAVSEDSRKTRRSSETDPRGEERVFGLLHGGKSVALPLATLPDRPAILDGPDGSAILWDPSTKTAAAYELKTEGESSQSVTLNADGKAADAPFVDETGSRWSTTGRATSGPRKGATLAWLPGVMVKRFAWEASYPAAARDGAE